MDGFKNSTKTQYSMGGYAKGGSKGTAKVGKVMGEFKAGTLHSGSKKGPEVTNPKQAIAIGLSEARKAGAKFPVKRGEGGPALPDAARRQIEAEMNDMNPADRARALKMLGRAPAAVVKKTTTVVAPLPKKAVPVASRTPYVPSSAESAGDAALIDARRRGMSPGYKKGGMADLKQDKATVKAAVHKHEAAMHPGKPMTKLRKGGMPC